MGANNNAVVAARVTELHARLLDGWSSTAAVRDAAERWHVSERTAWSYLRRALDQIERDAAEARKAAYAETLMALRSLRRHATLAEDWRLALDVLREEAKLLGLYPRQPVEVAPARPWPVTIVEVVSDERSDDVSDSGGDGEGGEG